MFPSFEVIPAVDIRNGEVVQLVGGDPETGTTYGDPLTAAQDWADAGATTLHIVDLDGAIEGRRRNADSIAEIVDSMDVAVQVGGGIRSADTAQTLLETGVDRVILGTAAINNPDLVSTLATDYPDGVVVSLDASEGDVLVEGWTETTGVDPATAAARYEELGAAAILFTDVDVEGRRTGVRTDYVTAVVDAVSIPVIASGGVGTIDDVLALRDAGAAACVVGTALYDGVFTIAEANDALRDTA